MKFLPQVDAFHEQATALTGWDDFGPDDYLDGMRRLLSDYDTHCRFNALGDEIAAAGMVAMLVGRLFDQHGIAAHPDFAAAPIEKPIIILGPPRSGSTALHRLLAQDPGNQWLAQWLACTPMPRPPRETWEGNRWYRMAKQGLDQLYAMNPVIKDIHPMAAGEPDECRFVIDHSFWSMGWAGSGNMPDYSAWAMTTDVRHVYRRYRQVLGLIAGGDRRRWVLKDPTCHLWAPEAMLDVFPDACIVFTHREPISAVKSLASLTWEVRRLREPDLTPQENARYQLHWWGKAMAKTDRERDRHDPARFVDIHVSEVDADPVGVAERIYRHFGIAVDDAARTAWQQHAATNARAGHGEHRHAVTDWGLSAAEIYNGVGPYYDRYQRLYGIREGKAG